MSATVLKLCLEASESLMALDRALVSKVTVDSPQRREVERWVCDMSDGMLEMMRALGGEVDAEPAGRLGLEPGSLEELACREK